MESNLRPPHVLFRVAAGPRAGFGHLIRARSLATALGIRPVVSVRGPEPAQRAARRLGMRVVAAVTAADVIRRQAPDVLVIDDRVAAATHAWRLAARRCGIPIVSIHDLGLGRGDADLVVDGTVGAELRWATLDGAALLGPRFSILNPGCVSVPRAPARRGDPQRVVIALGGGERRQVAARLASMIALRAPGAEVLVAGGFVEAARGSRERDHRVVDPSALGPALASATVAVVGGGVTLYEAAALRVPTVALAVVPSQRPTVEAFAERGAAVDGGLLASGSSALDRPCRAAIRLLRDAAARGRLERRAGALVDADGARRVASAIRRLLARSGRRAAVR